MQEQQQIADGAIAPPSIDDAPAELFVSQAEYARHRGVTRQAIGKLVAAEKLPIVLGDRGEILIDVVGADLALGENVERLDEPREETPAPSADTRKLTQHRAATEEYKAKMARLVYEQRLGKVLPIEQIEEACAGFGEAIVRIMHALPMFAEEIAAAAGKDGVAGARIALRGIERALLVRIGAACEELAKKATTAQASASDEGEIDELESDAA